VVFENQFLWPKERALSLAELMNFVRDSLEAQIPSRFWVIAEVADLRFDQTGNGYLELVEKEGDYLRAKAKGTIWSSRSPEVLASFEEFTGQRIKAGMKLLLEGRLRFHPVYGLSIDILAIDPHYSLGEMARKRWEILCRLQEEGLLERNRALPLPLVPQRIAVVASLHSAGLDDFLTHLRESLYAFSVTVFPTLVQGEEAERWIVAIFHALFHLQDAFDVVVLLRGGGSKVDLSCFDSEALGRAIATFPLPVLTGIGHTRDETIVDAVAHTALKTPTAVADFLVGRVRFFDEAIREEMANLERLVRELLEEEKEELWLWISRFRREATLSVRNHKEKVLRFGQELVFTARGLLAREESAHAVMVQKLKERVQQKLREEQNAIEKEKKTVELLHPYNILRRGYTITLCKGRVMKSVHDGWPGEEIATQFVDGMMWSEVKRVHGEP